MLQVTAKHKIFLAVQAVDFRCGIDALSAQCRRHLQAEPMSGHLFVFRNRRGNAIKVLTFDGQGFWLCQKRLSKGRFKHWPNSNYSGLSLNVAQLQVLLYNGDPSNVNTGPDWHNV